MDSIYDNLTSMAAEMEWQKLLDVLGKMTRDGFNRVVSENDTSRIVDFCLKDEFTRVCLSKWIASNLERVNSSSTKSKSQSIAYRETGNKEFISGDFYEGFRWYIKSVNCAPYDSEELSLALANRSSCLIRLKAYEEALSDINMALEIGYPDKLMYKILSKKGKVLIDLKQYSQALDVLKDAEKLFPSQDKGSKVHKDLIKSMDEAATNCNLDVPKIDAKIKRSVDHLLPKLKSGEHSNLKFMSAALDLKETAEKGRHIVANEDIKEGDVLFVEKPYAFVVLPGTCPFNPGCHSCHFCCAPLKQKEGVICRICSTAIYCTNECLKAAWEKFHRWECGGISLFYEIGIAHLGLRTTLVSYSEEQVGDGRLEQINSLMSHIQDMRTADLYQYTLTAAMLTLYLDRWAGFFVENRTDRTISKVGGDILLHICQLICNGHAITRLNTEPAESKDTDCVVSETQEWAATAIFPSASMMNHSCDSNIINSFCNEYLIVKALRKIPKGGEVFNCYGPDFRRKNTRQRKEELKNQYFFTCKCPPCLKEGSSEFPARFSAFVCSKCMGPLVQAEADPKRGKCQDCGNRQSVGHLTQKVAKANTLFDEGLTHFEAGNTKTAIDFFLKCLSVFTPCVYIYNKQLTDCKDMLAKSYAKLGNYSKSHAYLLECLPAVEEQFGENSIEVANELQKLTDVMMCLAKQGKKSRHFMNEGLDHAERARDIFELHYGIWNQSYKDIIEKIALLDGDEKVLKKRRRNTSKKTKETVGEPQRTPREKASLSEDEEPS